MKRKKLYKSVDNRMICGVCGGIADYFGIDATIVRLCWVAFTLLFGLGLVFYIVAALVMPREPLE